MAAAPPSASAAALGALHRTEFSPEWWQTVFQQAGGGPATKAASDAKRDLKKRVTIMKACWRVDLIGDRLLHVGSINADTADQAINEVAKLFRIEPAQRDKLMATEVQTRRERAL
jgi:hypothetical protein